MVGLMLVAASGLAREVTEILDATGEYDEICLLDDDRCRWGTTVGGHTVVGGLDLVREYDDHALVVCAGRGRVRRELVARLSCLGVRRERYARVVHPRAVVPDSCVIGRGSILLANVVLTADVTVGEHVVAMPQVTLTHDDVVGSFATLCAGVSLGGGVHVAAGAYLGMNAAVREGLVVGTDAVLGMSAALLSDLPDGEAWAGNPARPLALTRRS